MDFRKILVYLAIMVVVFILWKDWVQDHTYQQQKAAEIAAANKHVATQTTATTSPATTTATTKPAAAPVVKGELVHVKTDVIDAVINTAGGTIQKTSLLQYPEKEGSSKPVVLLNNNARTKYVAQGGLMSNGVQQAAVYQTAKTNYVLQPGQKSLTVNLTWTNPQGIAVTKSFIFTRNKYVVNVNYTLKNTGHQAWQGKVYNQIARTKVAQAVPGVLHFTTFMGAATSSPQEHYKKYSFSNLSDQQINQAVKGGWVSMIQHYFISAWIPNQKTMSQFYSKVVNSNLYVIGLTSAQMQLLPGQTATTALKFYAGPADYNRLKAIAPYLNLTVDFGWLWFISIILFWLMVKIHMIVGNWGWSIVIVTLIIKLLFYKLSDTSYRSMGRMRKLQPKLKALKEQHGGDRSKLGQATMELYKAEKVNPFGGCLPILVQIPVFLALYYVLIESVQLRQAPFILWIHNLAAPDPFYILPILMGLTMFLQQRLSPAPPDPMQAKVMMILPVVMTILFLNFPAGLVLYWFINNLASISQQYYVLKTLDKRQPKKKSWKKK